ncbi:MAG: hypothetical protein WCG83_04535 [Candidatus Peregrinibacteria bacterium]
MNINGESLRTRQAQNIEAALLSNREIVSGVPIALLEQYGQFVDAQNAPGPESKTILLTKYVHGNKNSMGRMRDRRKFDAFIAHQDAVYGLLNILSERLNNNYRLRVALELLLPHMKLSDSFFQSVQAFQIDRDRALDRIQCDLSSGADNVESLLSHLDGGIRFLVKEYFEGRLNTVVPGRPTESAQLVRMLSEELNKLVRHTYDTRVFDTSRAQEILTRNNDRIQNDFAQRHEFVAQEIMNGLSVGNLGVVLYGAAHFRGGLGASPLEEHFPHCRVFVFEPHKMHEADIDIQATQGNWVRLGMKSVDEVREAVRKSLATSDRPMPSIS